MEYRKSDGSVPEMAAALTAHSGALAVKRAVERYRAMFGGDKFTVRYTNGVPVVYPVRTRIAGARAELAKLGV